MILDEELRLDNVNGMPGMRAYEKKAHAIVMFRREKEAIRKAIEPEPEIVCEGCNELIDLNDAEQVRYRTCGACLGR